MEVKYSNENTLEILERFKSRLATNNFDNFAELIYEYFNDDECTDKIKSLKHMLHVYENEPKYREGIDLAFITLTGYSIGTIMEKAIELDDEEEKEGEGFNFPTKEQERATNAFFEDNTEYFIPAIDFSKYTEDELESLSVNEKYLHEDFKEACEISNREGVYSYTFVDCGDSFWIIDGYHYCNRHGYYFTTKKIEIPEEGLRY